MTKESADLLLLIAQMVPYVRDADTMDIAAYEARISILNRAEAFLRADNERAFEPSALASELHVRGCGAWRGEACTCESIQPAVKSNTPRECQCATYCMMAAGAIYDPPIKCRGLTGEDPGAHLRYPRR